MTPESGSARSLFHAGAGLAATVRRINRNRVRDRPDVRARAAVAGPCADLWAGARVARAGEVRVLVEGRMGVPACHSPVGRRVSPGAQASLPV